MVLQISKLRDLPLYIILSGRVGACPVVVVLRQPRALHGEEDPLEEPVFLAVSASHENLVIGL